MRLLGGLLLLGLLAGCEAGSAKPSRVVAATTTPQILGVSEVEPVLSASPQPRGVSEVQPVLTAGQRRILKGARSTLGDAYDAGYYAGGPPPEGKGACTDVLYAAYKADGLNLQDAMEKDIGRRPEGYPNLRDANIDYRWAPNLIVWYGRYMKKLSLDGDFQPGDVVFWNLTGDGVADHCGIVSDRMGPQGPLMIHNFPPRSREDDALRSWRIVGHFRRG